MKQDTTKHSEAVRFPDAVARKNGPASMSDNLTAEIDAFSIEALIEFIKRQWSAILKMAIVFAIPLLTYVMLMEKRFTSTALVAVDVSSSELIQGSTRRPSPDTEVEIMRSINIVTDLGKKLAAEPNGEKIFQQIRPLNEEASENNARPSSRDLIALRKRFNVRRRGLTDVIAIEAWAKTPEMAAKFANMYAKIYLDAQVEQRIRSIERIEMILAERLKKIKAQLDVPGAPIALRKVYGEYLAQSKQVRRSRSAVVPYMRVAAKALPLDRPSFPPRLFFLVLAAMTAGLAATTVAFIKDCYFDNVGTDLPEARK